MKPRGILITATDTGVGKTVATAGLALALERQGVNVHIYKPLQSGGLSTDPISDGMVLQRLTGSKLTIEQIVTYSFERPVTPALAAKLEGTDINRDRLVDSYYKLANGADLTLVEGAGGLMAPMGENWTMIDLALHLKLSLIVVARPNLGTINHTLLTVLAAQQKGLDVLGIIFNGLSPDDKDESIPYNAFYIEKFSGIPLLGNIPWLDSMTRPKLEAAILENINLSPIIASRSGELV